jgi:hypothetical protein
MRRITVAAVSLLLALGLAASAGGPASIQAGSCRAAAGRQCI